MKHSISYLLHRKRVDALLQQIPAHPLTVVIAGSGYGKTIAVTSFFQQSSIQHLWYQLTLLDQDTTRFWENFKLKIASYHPTLWKQISRLEFPNTMERCNRFNFMLMDSMKPETNYIMVFDDFHLVQDRNLMLFMDRLVNAQIPMLSVVIISRTYPPLNTARLMSNELLLEIKEDELRFTEREIHAYFYQQQIFPSEQAVSTIYQQTNGWILAIRLISLSLKRKPERTDFAFTWMKSKIFHCIENEIYEPLSEDAKRFLVTLSLFEPLSSELIQSLANGNGNLIAAVTDGASSMIRYDQYENTYYFHHLFLEFLATKQHLLTQEDQKNAYMVAGRWYVTHHHKIDAITCFKNAKDYASMLTVISTFPTMISTSLCEYMIHLLDSITDMQEDRYFAKIMFARYAVMIKPREELHLLFHELETEFEQLPDSPDKSHLLCSLYAIIGTYRMLTTGRNFLELFERSYHTGAKAIVTTVYSVGTYASHLLEPPSFGEFLQQVDTAIPYMVHVLNGCGSGLDHLSKGEYAFFQRDLETAELHLLQTIVNAKQEKQYYIEDLASFYLLRIHICKGNYTGVLRIIEQLKQQTKIYEYSDAYTMCAVASGWFYAQIRCLDKSIVWNSKDMLDPKDMTSTSSYGLFQLLIARCYLTQKRYNECMALLHSLDHDKIVTDYFFGKLEVTTLKAVTLYHLNEKELNSVDTR